VKGNAIMVISKKIVLGVFFSIVGLQMYGIGGPGGGNKKKVVVAASQGSGSAGSGKSTPIVETTSLEGEPSSGNYLGLGWCLSSGNTATSITITDTTGQQYVWSNPSMQSWEYYVIGDNPVKGFEIVTNDGTTTTTLTVRSIDASSGYVYFIFDTASLTTNNAASDPGFASAGQTPIYSTKQGDGLDLFSISQ